MERRILAELFVEDDKAIEMDKGTIDYAKDVIDCQCQECGISTGDMRILDEDDLEDAKASDLADKIFNSEENKPVSVWLVRIDSAYNGQNDLEERIFSTYSKAKAYFNDCVADEKANDHLMELDSKVVDEYDDRFSLWEDGCFCGDHYEITIEEKVVF